MDEIDELAQLEELLNADLGEKDKGEQKKVPSLSEVDLFKPSIGADENIAAPEDQDKTSAVHNGDTDSSDDEDRRNYLERKYNDCGSQIKKTLDNQEEERHSKRLDFESRLRQSNLDAKTARQNSFLKKPEYMCTVSSNKNTFCAPEAKTKGAIDIYTDPVFGIRITRPLISSTALLDRMQGRNAVTMLRMQRYVENEDLSNDWIIGGVIVRKSTSKKSQKGSQFLIWTLSDLKDDLKTVSLFLFRKAYNDLWKTSEGTVVAVLNPNVLDKSQNSSDQACLSVDNSDRVMILGQSKDLGICKSKKKDGQPCTAFVNINQCEHCIYHVKQEYQKFSRRQELQSSTMGKGLVNLQNKVLGKSTVIYGGKAYSALPTGNIKKVKQQDQNRLMSLSDYYKTEDKSLMSNKVPHGVGPVKQLGILHSPAAQRKSDSDRLSKLNDNPTFSQDVTVMSSLAEKVAKSPRLGSGFSLKGSGTIDLNISYSQKMAERAKANAIRIVQQNGGIKKIDPHNVKGTGAGKKRVLERFTEDSENDSKKAKTEAESKKATKGVMSERFKKILEATSSHKNLIQQHDNDEQDKYFNKLEKKEAMEEKMLNTFKLACKAVRCAKCKYTAFSASQQCKDERHPLKVLDTFKRFFKCGNCGNRTVSLEIIPLHSCSNCASSKWEKAPMMREKKVISLSDGLSIRGEEESYIGGQVTAGKNINLLVPDD